MRCLRNIFHQNCQELFQQLDPRSAAGKTTVDRFQAFPEIFRRVFFILVGRGREQPALDEAGDEIWQVRLEMFAGSVDDRGQDSDVRVEKPLEMSLGREREIGNELPLGVANQDLKEMGRWEISEIKERGEAMRERVQGTVKERQNGRTLRQKRKRQIKRIIWTHLFKGGVGRISAQNPFHFRKVI